MYSDKNTFSSAADIITLCNIFLYFKTINFPLVGSKFLTLDDVKVAYAECKKEIKEQGNYEEFVKCMKLYDKTYNGKLIPDELSYSLLCLG